jgi:hypothetical protein
MQDLSIEKYIQNDGESSAEINVDKLQEIMTKSMIKIEATLFQHAEYETKRISSLRAIITQVEDEIFDPEIFKDFDPVQKRFLYSLANKNLNTSVDFLKELHDSMVDGVDIVSKIKALGLAAESKPKGTVIQVVDQKAATDLKKEIMAEIKSRSKPKEKKK